MSHKILVVDDKSDSLKFLECNLKAAGFEVATAADGEEALQKARTVQPALILLDVSPPQIDRGEVCKLLKRDPATASIPIIMLTAKAAGIDPVHCAQLGVDDYLPKPFSPRELVLHIKGLLRRKAWAAEEKEDLLQIGEVTIDLPRHEVRVAGQRVELTLTEFKLLTVLARRRGHVQSRDHLLREVWKDENLTDTRTVDTHMSRLRDKLGQAARHLETVCGVGYRFAEA